MGEVSTRATQPPVNYAKSIMFPDLGVSSALRTKINPAFPSKILLSILSDHHRLPTFLSSALSVSRHV
jgi:hypothetical protein